MFKVTLGSSNTISPSFFDDVVWNFIIVIHAKNIVKAKTKDPSCRSQKHGRLLHRQFYQTADSFACLL